MYHVYVKCTQRTIINNNIDVHIWLAVATSVNVKEAPIHLVSIGRKPSREAPTKIDNKSKITVFADSQGSRRFIEVRKHIY